MEHSTCWSPFLISFSQIPWGRYCLMLLIITVRVFFYKNIQAVDNSKTASADRPDIVNMKRTYFSLKSTLLSLTFSFVSGCADFGSIRNILPCSICFDRRI